MSFPAHYRGRDTSEVEQDEHSDLSCGRVKQR